MLIGDLVQLSGSWNTPPAMKVTSKRGSLEATYDQSQKAYVVRSKTGPVNGIQASIESSATSPLFNPALVIEGWGQASPEIAMNGKKLKAGEDFSFGYEKKHQPDRFDCLDQDKVRQTGDLGSEQIQVMKRLCINRTISRLFYLMCLSPALSCADL